VTSDLRRILDHARRGELCPDFSLTRSLVELATEIERLRGSLRHALTDAEQHDLRQLARSSHTSVSQRVALRSLMQCAGIAVPSSSFPPPMDPTFALVDPHDRGRNRNGGGR
jgi:hypothetical protein